MIVSRHLMRLRPVVSYPRLALRSLATDAAAPVPSAVAASTPAAPTKPVEQPKAEPKPSAPVKAKEGSSVWQRTVAFMVGVAVSSVYYFHTVRDDVAASSASIAATLEAYKVETAQVNEDLRKRIGVLEHEVAAMKQAK
jgi:hypothetical protein